MKETEEETKLKNLISVLQERNAVVLGAEICMACMQKKNVASAVILDLPVEIKGVPYSAVCVYICLSCQQRKATDDIVTNFIMIANNLDVVLVE